jgi:VWFA-related protein
MMLRPRVAWAALLVLTAWPVASSPQDRDQTTPAFPSRVEVVTVDVVVVDAKGRAVPGFTRSDFVVLEDGTPQAATSFQAVELPPLPPPSAPAALGPRVSTNTGPEAAQTRTFVIVFDDVHLSAEQALRAKAVIGEFLRTGVRSGDRVTLIATMGSAWWSARMPEGREGLVTILKRLDGRYVPDSSPDRMTDYEAMRIMAYDDPDVAYQVKRRFDAYGSMGKERQGDRQYADTLRTDSHVGIVDPYVRNRAQDVYRQVVERRRIAMGVMTRALRALADVKGRKAMILVSQGFIYEQSFKEMKALVEASTRVNVPIHFIDTRGLKALPEFMTVQYSQPFDVQDTVAVLADISREAEGAENVALDTGGLVVKNTNDLESGIRRVSAESQAFYLLGYTPTNSARDGRFRRIEVRLAPGKGKGLKIRARRGYYAPEEGATVAAAAVKSDPEIIKALDSPFERREVPLRVSAFSFDAATMLNRVNVIVATEIDLREVKLVEEEGRFKGAVAFLIEAQHRETGEYYRTDEKIEMAVLPQTLERLRPTGYTVPREFSLAPGGYQVKVVVRDLATGRLGSVTHDFEVPSPSGFRISTPLLSDTLEPQNPGASGPSRPVLQVSRRVPAGGTLWVQYSVFGAEKDESSQLPRVSAGYEIRRADGSVFKVSPATRINPTSLGSLLRLNGINLAGAAPGPYELVIRLRDEIARRDVEVREPFEVTTG